MIKQSHIIQTQQEKCLRGFYGKGNLGKEMIIPDQYFPCYVDFFFWLSTVCVHVHIYLVRKTFYDWKRMRRGKGKDIKNLFHYNQNAFLPKFYETGRNWFSFLGRERGEYEGSFLKVILKECNFYLEKAQFAKL